MKTFSFFRLSKLFTFLQSQTCIILLPKESKSWLRRVSKTIYRIKAHIKCIGAFKKVEFYSESE